MRPLIQRILLITWPLAIAVIVLSGSVGLCADEDHDAADHAAGETHIDDGHDGAAENGAAHEDGAHEEHGGVDYNDVPLFFDAKLFFWSLGLFVLFVFAARRFAWTPLIRGLDAREARVNQALHDAEAARIEAEKLLARHDARMEEVQEEVKGIVAAARKEAEAEKARIIAEADGEAAALRNQAIAAIEAAHRQAIDDLDARIDQQAVVATEHVLGQTR